MEANENASSVQSSEESVGCENHGWKSNKGSRASIMYHPMSMEPGDMDDGVVCLLESKNVLGNAVGYRPLRSPVDVSRELLGDFGAGQGLFRECFRNVSGTPVDTWEGMEWRGGLYFH